MGQRAMFEMPRERGAIAGRLGSAQGRPADSDVPDVAGNLRRLRRQLGLSLETLAKQSGVSRAMLGQIETGKSVPTVTLVWKVAKALGVTPTDLIASPIRERATLVRRSKIRTLTAGNGGFTQWLFASPELPTPFDLSEIHLDAGHREDFPPLAAGTRAALVVTSGRLDVTVDGDAAVYVEEGDAVLFCADLAHSISNATGVRATGYLVVASRRM